MGYSQGGYLWWMVFKAICFILASFVFSVVFWTTKHWLEQKPKKKK